MIPPALAALACFLAAMALVTVDDPSRGQRAGRLTWLAALVVASSAAYLVLSLASPSPATQGDSPEVVEPPSLR